MKPPFQSRQGGTIHAPVSAVWEFNQDLSRIAEYHPRVDRVYLISNKKYRETGVAYMCHLKDGKNMCLERDIEIIPLEKIVTALPQDTMGLSKLLPDYVVETLFTPTVEGSTKMEFVHYYSTPTLTAKLANFLIKRKIANESRATLYAIKKSIEGKGP
jgi:hypothetical protein